jgi:hypothetical protein
LSQKTEKLLNDAAERYPAELLHNLAVSLASYIAAIDSDSHRVSAYLERRLAPLLEMARTDIRSRDALERILRDGRDP